MVTAFAKPQAPTSGGVHCLLKALAGSLLLASCVTPGTQEPEAASAGQTKRAFWEGDGVAGAPKIVINLSEQRLKYYKGGQLVGLSPVATGRAGYNTPSGSFSISGKDMDHRSSCYGDYVDASGRVVVADIDNRKDPRPPGTRYLGASMRYFMRVNGPIGMHEGYLPGVPASHGCIRLPTDMAALFFRETPHGTPVQITGHASAAPRESAIAVGEPVLGGMMAVRADPAQAKPVPAKKETKSKAAPRKAKKADEPPRPRGQTLYLTD